MHLRFGQAGAAEPATLNRTGGTSGPAATAAMPVQTVDRPAFTVTPLPLARGLIGASRPIARASGLSLASPLRES
jgi:hypothetical protein